MVRNRTTQYLDNTPFFRKLEEYILHIPKPEKVAGTILPYVAVGDEGFGLTMNSMRSYLAEKLTNSRIFNYRCREQEIVFL